MRKVLSFLVWLFSFWTWKDFFLRWLRRPASHPASGETAEHLPSQEGQHESEFARSLSSLPGECWWLNFYGDWDVIIFFAFTSVRVEYREFLEAVASSKIDFREEVEIYQEGDGSCKRVEEFAAALRQSSNGIRKLEFLCRDGSAVRFAKCVSSVLLENETIQDLYLDFAMMMEKMDKELAEEFVVIITQPHIIRILKSFKLEGRNLDEEGMEKLMKPFRGPSSVLEELGFYSATSAAQLEHLSGILASSTSLKTLEVFPASSGGVKVIQRGYTSTAVALCFNQTLEALTCGISCSTELLSLLDPLIPKNQNDLQPNVTLTKLNFYDSIGGKEGVKAMVDLIHTNTSLLELGLRYVDDLSSHDRQGVENVLAIMEALKTNKKLKKIRFYACKAVGGYKVLGTMMDLLLENPSIEDIDLRRTGLEESYKQYTTTKLKSPSPVSNEPTCTISL